MRITKPIAVAQDFLCSLGWSEPGDLSLEEMVFSSGAILKETPLKGSEGRILINRNSAIITIDSGISLLGKKNFVIAHEIGHFLLHKNIAPLYSDTERTLAEWHKYGIHEQEANAFASELLMPSHLFKKKVDRKKLSLSLLEDVASYFDVSITAAFIKYSSLGNYPLMVIYIEGGLIKWKQASNDFPFQYLPIGSKVPVWTVAGELYYKSVAEERPEQVDAIEWFESDFRIKHKEDCKLWEQCFQVTQNGILTCLWTS